MSRFFSGLASTAALSSVLAANALATQTLDPGPLARAVQDQLDVSAFTLQSLELPPNADMGFATEVDLGAYAVTLEAWTHEVRGIDFRILVDEGDENLREIEPTAPRTIRGHVAGLPGSTVVGNLVDGQLTAIIETQEIGNWAIQPLTSVRAGAAPAEHVVYDFGDLVPREEWGCIEVPTGSVDDEPGLPIQGTGRKWCEMAVDCDVEFYQLNQSSVPATVNDVEMIINRVSNIYERDVDVHVDVGVIVVRTSEPDPYSTSEPSNLLGQFRSHWNQNMSVVKRDATHLMTGKNLNGTTIGIAYLQGICNSNRYGVSQSRFSGSVVFRAGLTAHELGHNYAAQHCSGGTCFIMCAGLGGCGGSVLMFGQQSINVITNYSNTRGCTNDLANPIDVNWSESFEVLTIDENIFPTWQGAQTSTSGDNEPDGVRSLNLDAVNSNTWSRDYVRTNFFNMAGETTKAVSLYSQHKGVESGEVLEVNYLNDALDWTNAIRVFSDGSNQSVFEFHIFDLPADAYHDEFRIEVRAGVDEANDDWYVDNLAIEDGCPLPANYCLTSPNSFGAGAIMTYFGGTNISANNLSLLVTGAVPGQFGIFYYGTGQIQNAFGNGWRCVTGSITRLGLLQLNAFGEATQAFDAVGEGVSPGANLNFQFWYRDPMGGGAAFNLSDGLETVWCP